MEDLEPYAALDAGALLTELQSLDAVDEVVILQTCNRFEAHVAGPDPVEARGMAARAIAEAAADELILGDDAERDLGLASARHLFRVAAGLESMIVGEDQILGQVKDAYRLALDHGTVGPDLSLLWKKAIQVGKRVRTETAINRGAVSIGSAAVDLAIQDLGTLRGRSLLVLGAGEMGELVARSLLDHQAADVTVVSRRLERAQHLAHKLGGRSLPYERYLDPVPKADVIICATSAPHHLLDRERLEAALGPEGAPDGLLLIDISNPRNVADDVVKVPGVTLRNLDSLQKVAAANLQRRRGEVEKARDLVERQLLLLSSRLEERRAEDAIRALHQELRRVRDAEYARALQRVNGMSDHDKEVMRDLVSSAMNKLLAAPTLNLKRAAKEGDAETIDALVRLFDLDPDPEVEP